MTDYGTGTDNRIVADGDARQNGCAAANPYIVSNSDRHRPLVAHITFGDVERVTSCIDAHIRADKGMVADSDRGFVKNGQIEVCKKVFADEYIATIVAAKRLVDVIALAVAA